MNSVNINTFIPTVSDQINNGRALCSVCGKKDFLGSLTPFQMRSSLLNLGDQYKPICYLNDLNRIYIKKNLFERIAPSDQCVEAILVNPESQKSFQPLYIPQHHLNAGSVTFDPDSVFNSTTGLIESCVEKTELLHRPDLISRCWPIDYALNKALFDAINSDRRIQFELEKNDTMITNKANPFKDFDKVTSFFYDYGIYLSPIRVVRQDLDQARLKLCAVDHQGYFKEIYNEILKYDPDPLMTLFQNTNSITE